MSNSEAVSENKQSPVSHRRIGNGPPVLLIHGFGEDRRVWDGVVNELEKEYSLIIPDLPGTGLSPLVPDMSIEGMAEALVPILPEGPIAVIGHSMGGYIALALLGKYPDKLNSLALFHSTSYADSDEKKQARLKSIEFIKQHGAFEFLKTSIPNLFSALSKQKMAGAINDFIDQQAGSEASSLIAYYEAMMNRPDRRSLLKNSRIPLLFLLGKYDVAVPFSDGLAQCHLPAISYIHILRRSGHMGMMEEAESANKALKNYLFQVHSIQ
ncbi:MAG: alpha/beta hydrolase [Chitinophagaceae bacterium]|nr:alpha/beta hydrolase [Chitinophagaceae bacterium]